MAGDHSFLKSINRMALVRLVKDQPGLSRVDLAHRTGLTKTTVGLLVQELVAEGWLRERAPAVSQAAGRRPTPLTLATERFGLIGAELGVDYLNVVACDLQGELLHARMRPFRHRDVGRSVRSLSALVARARDELLARRRRPLGLGVGVPGAVGARDGLLRRLLEASLARAGWRGLEVAVLNEAKAAALSEHVFGAGHHGGPLVYLSLGIGLGAGVILRDRLYLGHDGLAGEVGHTILQRAGPRCACGRRGCAETFISQRAVSRSATGGGGPVLSIAELGARLARRDPATRRAVARAGAYLGILIQNLRNTFDPAVVVLGGPLSQLGAALLEPAVAGMQATAGRYDHDVLSVRLCRFGVNACALGAAGSVFQRRLHPYDGGEVDLGPYGAPDAAGAARP
jgi:predicted NBD/HSP70 family sugar kinase